MSHTPSPQKGDPQGAGQNPAPESHRMNNQSRRGLPAQLTDRSWECLARVDADPLAVAAVMGIAEDAAARQLAAARLRMAAALPPLPALPMPPPAERRRMAGHTLMSSILERPDLPGHCYRRLGK